MKFSRYIFRMFPSSGDNEIRTRDPLLARQVLSHLSYTPLRAPVSPIPPESPQTLKTKQH